MGATGTADGTPEGGAGGLRQTLGEFVRYTPSGDTIPDDAWRRRHRTILVFLVAHVPFLLALGLYEGTEAAVTGATIPATPLPLVALELGVLLAFAGLASVSRFSRRTRTALASTGVLAASVVLVQFSGGFIEAHFHFFVGMAVIAVYEDWLPFALGLTYVVVTHGVFGMVEAERVYNHTAAINNPWVWGLVHGAFVLMLAGALMANWYSTEKSREQSRKRLREARAKAEEVENLEAKQAEIEREKAEAERMKAEAEEAKAEAEARQREVAALNERLEATADEYSEAMRRAADGDLGVRLDADDDSEAMAEIAAAFNEMMADTEAAMREIQSFADSVAAASEEAETGASEAERASGEVSESVQEIAGAADEQREMLSTVTGELTDLSAAIEEVAASADSVAEHSHQTAEIARSGEKTAERAIESSRDVQAAVNSTVENVEGLDEQMAEIGDIVELIGDIAEQTNMLALNANIEAARADQDGDGFAVVANEVKDLAEETRESANDIESLIGELQARTATTVEEAREAERSMQAGIDAVEEVVDAFAEVSDHAEETDTGVQEISETTDDQAASTEEAVSMAEEVADLGESTATEAQNASAAAQQQAASMSQVSSNVASLSEQAERLQSLLSGFDVSEADAPAEATTLTDGGEFVPAARQDGGRAE